MSGTTDPNRDYPRGTGSTVWVALLSVGATLLIAFFGMSTYWGGNFQQIKVDTDRLDRWEANGTPFSQALQADHRALERRVGDLEAFKERWIVEWAQEIQRLTATEQQIKEDTTRTDRLSVRLQEHEDKDQSILREQFVRLQQQQTQPK